MSRPTPAAIILAAGQGTRMHSNLPKVLHPCAGMPMVAHVVALALELGCQPIVVVVGPHNRAGVEQALERFHPDAPIVYAEQAQARGTGDAVRVALGSVPATSEQAVILYGDVPLLTAQTMRHLGKAAEEASLALLTAELEDPSGYGRLVRNARGEPERVVEHKDASEGERAIREVNAGVYWASLSLLRAAVSQLTSKNSQNELYLTDVVAIAAREEGGAKAVVVEDIDEIRGVNNKVELGEVERLLRARLVRLHQLNGVNFIDPKHVVLSPRVKLGRDVTIGPGVQMWGRCEVGEGSIIDGPTYLMDSQVAKGAHVRSFCHLEGANVGEGAQIGPYARLRPEADIGPKARVGNFVEVKKSRLDAGAKVNHLAYIGDAHVGAEANVGAGTITCNYDGFHKHQTTIGKGVFVGSNSTLVAPLALGDGAFVAAGSVITQDVPQDALAFGRARQAVRENYAKELKARLSSNKS